MMRELISAERLVVWDHLRVVPFSQKRAARRFVRQGVGGVNPYNLCLVDRYPNGARVVAEFGKLFLVVRRW